MKGLETLPGHLLRRMQQISVALFTARMAEAGLDLTPVQFAALTALRTRPGLDQQTLATLIAYDRVTLADVVDRLVKKGLVVRETSPVDRRARVLTLSPEGEATLAAATPWVERVQDDIVEPLSPVERRTFIGLLAKLTEARDGRRPAPLHAAPGGTPSRLRGR